MAYHAQEEAVEYVAATVRKLTQEAAMEGVRRLFLISVSASQASKPNPSLVPAGRGESALFRASGLGCACPS